jgi:hypothetical protein
MRSSHSLMCVLFSGLLATSALAARSATLSPAERSRIDAVFKEQNKAATPGCAVGVMRNGLSVFSRGYGMADLERSVAIDSEQLDLSTSRMREIHFELRAPFSAESSKTTQHREAKPAARETLTSDITLEPGARAASLESLSGAITLSRGARVSGNVSSDYGSLVLEPKSEVIGHLSSDGGSIRIDGARVGRGITTTSGDIDIGPDSQIDGGILVRKRGVIGLSLGFFQLGVPAGRSTPPRVVIGPGATVTGQLRFKRKVQLFVSERATIGPVEGATPVVFTGERPPS